MIGALIGAGHRRSDIDGYTLAQVKLHFAAVQRWRRRAMADQVRAVSLAIGAAFGADVNATLKELDE